MEETASGPSRVTNLAPSGTQAPPPAGPSLHPSSPGTQPSPIVKRFSSSTEQSRFDSVTIFRKILSECVFNLRSMPKVFLELVHRLSLKHLCTHIQQYNEHIVKEVFANIPSDIDINDQDQSISVLC